MKRLKIERLSLRGEASAPTEVEGLRLSRFAASSRNDDCELLTVDCGLDRKGAILLIALIGLVSLSLFGAALVSMVFWRSEMMQLEHDRLRAFYLAEAGISKALYELKTDDDPDADGVGNVASTAFGEGAFEAVYHPVERTITAQGTVNQTTRTVQIVFSSQK